MTKPLPIIPGFDAPAGIGHNNPPESERLKLDDFKAYEAEDLFKGTAWALKDALQKVKDATAGFHADVSTDDGRASIRSLAYSLKRVKTILDDKGKDLNSALRKDIDAVDKLRRQLRDTIDGEVAIVSTPLDQYEAAEEARKEKLAADLLKVKNAVVFYQEPDLATIQQRIDLLNGFAGYDWQEHGDVPSTLISDGLRFLNEKHATRAQQIKDQEELARLRAAEAARQVQQAPVEQPRVETHSPYPDENGVRHAPPGSVPAKPSTDDRKREINGWIVEAITSVNCAVPITEEQAKAIVIAIVRGQVPNVTITY